MIAVALAVVLMHAEVLAGWREFCQSQTWNPTDYDRCLSEAPQLRRAEAGDWLIDLSFLTPHGEHVVYTYARLPHSLGF